MARPTDYNEEILEKARGYLAQLPEDEVIHSIEGLAEAIGIVRSTIYKWRDEEGKEEFSDILEEILAKQGKVLVNKGLNGDFNSPITKVMLTKHGYREGKELTGKDGEKLGVSDENQALANEALKKFLDGK
jgi:intein/homing endonuclease